MRYLLCFLLSVPAFAQFNGNLPNVRQSFVDQHTGGSQGSITTAEAVKIGSILGVCLEDSVQNDTFTVGSTPSETWTVTSPANAGPSHDGGYESVAIAWTVAHSNAQYTITATGNPSGTGAVSLEPFEIVNASGADGTAATVGQLGGTTISTSRTTTKNGSVIVSCNSSNENLFPARYSLAYPNQFVAHEILLTNDNDIYTSVHYTTTAGSYTQTLNVNGSGSGVGNPAALVMVSQAFAPPSGITIATTLMPSATTTAAYKATLRAVGGSGALTYSVSSGTLPTGLTLTGATGVISGTATTPGTSTFSVQATDGTLTSPAQSLTITVTASSFFQPTIAEINPCNTLTDCPITGNLGRIILLAHGVDEHGTIGWLNSADTLSGANGMTFVKVPQFSPDDLTGGLVAYIQANDAPCAANTTIKLRTSAGSFLSWEVIRLFNSQLIVDSDLTANNVAQQGNTPSSYSLTTTYTNPVDNELLLGYSVSDHLQGINDSGTASIASPWTNVNNGYSLFNGTNLDYYVLSTDGSGAAGTNTNEVATAAPSADNVATNSLTTLLMGIRPGLSSGAIGCPAPSAEKIRRFSW